MSNQHKKVLNFCVALLGLVDASYLTSEHYNNVIPPCSLNVVFADCGKVLTSTYATVLGLPLSVIGIFHYALLALLCLFIISYKNKHVPYVLLLQTGIGFIASLYFIYLQIAVIHAICFYCFISAFISTFLFFTSQWLFHNERITLRRHILKRLRG
jgi:uncharacterized membrane protein